jgi:hypothetical protein
MFEDPEFFTTLLLDDSVVQADGFASCMEGLFYETK